MLASNPALASIFASALQDAGCQVAVFSSLPGLATYLRIAPVDVAVLDLDLRWNELVETVRALRSAPRNANPLLETIVLTHVLPFGNLAETARIGTILRKPVGPNQLVGAVHQLIEFESRIAPVRPRHQPAQRQFPPTRPAIDGKHMGNVIPLFSEGRERR